MPILSRRRIVAAKIEASEGVAESITAADAGIMIVDPKFDPDIKMNPREVLSESLSNFAPIPGSQAAKLSFRAEIKGAGSAYAAANTPALGKYLRACGFAETVDETPGSESAIYLPASTGIPSLTLALYNDGVKHVIRGARGTVKFGFTVGEICYADFTFTGVYDSTIDEAMISPTYEAHKPPVLLGAAFTVDSFAAKISQMEIDMACEIALRTDISSDEGYFSALLTGRKPTGNFDPEAEKVATYDWYNKWKGGTPGAMSFDLGSVQYNKVGITAPALVYTKVAEGDRSSLLVANTSFELAMSSGDDEIQLTFD